VQAAPLERPRPDGRLNPSEVVEVRIVFPEMDAILDAPRVEVHVEINNFEMKKNGPHLHLVLDNGLFMEHFNPRSPFIFENLAPGAHVLAVFAVASWHESWKNEEAAALVKFYVLEKEPDPGVDLERPILIFNMPQGKVEKWSGSWILFDFLTVNVATGSSDTLMQNYRVQYLLDGKSHSLEYRESRFWLEMQEGEHQISTYLSDLQGRPVINGGWNWAKHSFYVFSPEEASRK
jgi:hypothetical protein